MDNQIHKLIGELLIIIDEYDLQSLDCNFEPLKEIIESGIALKIIHTRPEILNHLKSLKEEIEQFDPLWEITSPNTDYISDEELEIEEDWTKEDIEEARYELAREVQIDNEMNVIGWINDKLEIVIDELKNFDALGYTAQKLLYKNENIDIEYKSTLLWDINKNINNVKMEDQVVRAIASFMNTQDGYVLIGVNDNGMPIGLDHDMSFLSTVKWDDFLLRLTDLLVQSLGKTTNQFIRISQEEENGKKFCLCWIKKSKRPVYALMKESKLKKFFIRYNNETHELKNHEEIQEYISENWYNKK